MTTQQTPLIPDIHTGAFSTLTEAFPALTKDQLERIRALSKVRTVNAGEILFEPGDAQVPFFVLL